jgi:ribosomal-protein-serine acetyltransferase
MFSHILDDDTRLRLLTERDAKEMHALTQSNLKYLSEWLPWPDPSQTVGDTHKFIRESAWRNRDDDGFIAGIWHVGRLTGVFSYHGIDRPDRSTSIGYWLAAGYQGKGLMTGACRVLVDHAFDELGLNRVEIRCATGNRKSRAIPERLGFTNEGTLRLVQWLHDRFVDHVVYGMLAKDWNWRD